MVPADPPGWSGAASEECKEMLGVSPYVCTVHSSSAAGPEHVRAAGVVEGRGVQVVHKVEELLSSVTPAAWVFSRLS